MDKQPRRLIEQLQNIQLRQRKFIQQLQAENARLLSDLADIRQERDAFRGKVGHVRRENVELQNKLEEALTEYQDLKRERATLVRSVTTAAHTPLQSADLGPKILNMLTVLHEEQTESPPTTDAAAASKEKATRPKLRPYLDKELPILLKPKSPRPDHPFSTVAS
ncbi:hypothetical protein J3R83DRAFT_10623 [Lanmaoa asiatica]|nr:hypothetical protein J3R83DRAFT_10623 [Lanmaoa asiatica]